VTPHSSTQKKNPNQNPFFLACYKFGNPKANTTVSKAFTSSLIKKIETKGTRMMLLQKLGQFSNKTAQEVYKDLVESKNNWLHLSQSDNAIECENLIVETQSKPRFIIVQRVKELPKLFCSQ
jgi:hypothetical protein